ncbi:MAG TPA: 6-carboxytetrahydropterin synthase [Candidatus Binataceae bacterium]|jgi:6-pyruvoyltetrahydropterin/6-carboxytetrahydropterin synthase|nr:6-carboxytetrahydropterin synthase [Candidatus Binataceae bacterium]
MASTFAIHVAKENLKFSAAHFIAYPGFREPLHGHNYQVGARLEGQLDTTGYVLDFGLIKRLLKEIVDRLDERTLIPAQSDCLRIEDQGAQLCVRYDDDLFVLPKKDVALLEIMHSSAEELARLIADQLWAALQALGAAAGVHAMEIAVAEGPGQAAIYRRELVTAK